MRLLLACETWSQVTFGIIKPIDVFFNTHV